MTAVGLLAFISALGKRRYSFARRTDRLTVSASRQAQGRSRAIRLEVEKIILRQKEDRPVVPGAIVALCAKVQFRFDVRIVTARHMIWNKVDERFQSMIVNAFEEGFEFVETILRLLRVIGANVEVVLDCKRTARDPFEQIGIVRRLIDA